MTLYKTLGRVRATALAAALVLLAATAIVVVQPNPPAAYAHGGLTYPATRTYACYVDGVGNGQGGDVNPQNPMCQNALAVNGNYPFYNWFGNLLSNAGGRHREVVPDGHLCGPQESFSAFREPGTQWPTTELDAGQTITFQYNAWAKHPGTWTQYVTKDGWDPDQPLAWDDLEPAPFNEVTNPPLRSGGPQGDEYYWDVTLPDKSGYHVIYSIWTRSDSPEAFYNCADVVFNPQVPTTPTPTALAASTPTTVTAR